VAEVQDSFIPTIIEKFEHDTPYMLFYRSDAVMKVDDIKLSPLLEKLVEIDNINFLKEKEGKKKQVDSLSFIGEFMKNFSNNRKFDDDQDKAYGGGSSMFSEGNRSIF